LATEAQDDRMPLWYHLQELRWRIIVWLLFFVVSFVVALVFQNELMWLVTLPHRKAAEGLLKSRGEEDYAVKVERAAEKLKENDKELYEALIALKDELKRRDPSRLAVLKYEEAFLSYMKICLAAAFLISLPFGIYQLWRFVSAGLYSHEKKAIRTFLPFSFVLFVGGLVFGYFVLVPIGLRFLLAYGDPETLAPFITLGFYLSFFTTIMLALGIVFQLPLVMLIIAAMGIVTVSWLKRIRPYFLVGAFIIAAVFTPTTDGVTQTLLAIPLILLFELGIILVKMFVRREE